MAREPIKIVLLIDDDSDEHSLFCDALHVYNSTITCLTAYHCQGGYELAQEKKPDVIFLDMNLPGTSGIACLRKIKKMPAISKIPVYIFSASSVGESDIQVAIDAGAVTWIKKPNQIQGYTVIFSETL